MTDSPVVIVSGASRGVGVATARWLAVTLISRSVHDMKKRIKNY
jgi:NAD(P)-dependent dehydrogenase (short-subunit alcohol dehydrogenase family)